MRLIDGIIFYLSLPYCTFAFIVPQIIQSSIKSTKSTNRPNNVFYRPTDPKLLLLATITLDGQDIRGPITPLGNFVLVRIKDTLSSTSGGILLPDQSKQRPTEGEVIAAGPGKVHPHTGVRIHNPVSQGMNVLYGKFDGTPIVYNEEQMQMIRDDDVMLFYKGVQMTRENVMPCRDYVLIELDEEKLETSSGIVVAASVNKDNLPCIGTVFKVGDGRLSSTGKFTPSPVKVGERAKFKDYAGNEVKIEGKNFALVRMVDILCHRDE